MSREKPEYNQFGFREGEDEPTIDSKKPEDQEKAKNRGANPEDKPQEKKAKPEGRLSRLKNWAKENPKTALFLGGLATFGCAGMLTVATMGAAGPATLPLMIVGAAGVAVGAIAGAGYLAYKGAKAFGNWMNNKRKDNKAKREGKAFQREQEQARQRVAERKRARSSEKSQAPTMGARQANSMRASLSEGAKTPTPTNPTPVVGRKAAASKGASIT